MYQFYTPHDCLSRPSKKNSGFFLRQPISRLIKILGFGPPQSAQLGVFLPFWVFQCIGKIIRFKNIIFLHHLRLLVTPFEDKLVNFLKMTYFLAIQTIRFLPSNVHVTLCFLFVFHLPLHHYSNKVQKCTNFTPRMTIRHAIRRKTREFFKDDLFLDDSNYQVLAFHSPLNMVFFYRFGSSNASIN